MSDQEQYVDLQPDDPGWVRERLAGRPGPVRVILRAGDDDDDAEGHAMGATLRLQAFEDEDDTEGHAISIHFPSREAAANFRRRLMVTGVLTGTLVVGAAGGVGLANITSDATGTSAVTTAGSAAGMDWTQAERPGQAAGAASSDAEAPARGTTPIPE
jgi:hypothetical protein